MDEESGGCYETIRHDGDKLWASLPDWTRGFWVGVLAWL